MISKGKDAETNIVKQTCEECLDENCHGQILLFALKSMQESILDSKYFPKIAVTSNSVFLFIMETRKGEIAN